MTKTDIDDTARRLLAAVSELVAGPPFAAAEARVLGDLYLRLREQLEELRGDRSPEAAESLALTVYLSLLAEDRSPGPEALVDLKTRIEDALGKGRPSAEVTRC
ncbi:MAG: hypothetical protein KDD11_10320 [Acidobacteria bacterium]|nr:hypothetical protein [Acidobacteriota bacterium]